MIHHLIRKLRPSGATLILLTSFYTITIRSILILFSCPRPGASSALF